MATFLSHMFLVAIISQFTRKINSMWHPKQKIRGESAEILVHLWDGTWNQFVQEITQTAQIIEKSGILELLPHAA